MEKNYNHKEAEQRVNLMWQRGNFFTPKVNQAKKPFSIFLVPPNASGDLHIGNALMVALQDILARYHRAKGDSTLWLPGTDHGGYETQVSFERELEKAGLDRLDYSNRELFGVINEFVETNNLVIKNQIERLGASVDWSRFRYTMDKRSLESVNAIFKKMVSDNLIYRAPYMVYYCPDCSTILADIELKENKINQPLYFIKFKIKDHDEYSPLAITRPEFLFAATHVLIHPEDKRYAQHIGKILINPATGKFVEIVESKRKFNPEKCDPFLTPFCPSHKKFDYEYTLRHDISAQNLLDWEGKMLYRYAGIKPEAARLKEIAYLKENDLIEKIDDSYTDSVYLCKRGHKVESVIMLTWFLRMDDEKISLRKKSLEAMEKQDLVVLPRWREKGLTDWMKKMTDWPIARQNVWGIKMPIWYDVSNPEKYTVWFIDKNGERRCGNLKSFIDQGVTLDEISRNLERVYATQDAIWTLKKENGKLYLPETDTFDTWFSSGLWATIVYGDLNSDDFSYFYPSDSIIIGLDLLRLSISRKILLSVYLTGRLPFKTVFLHRLIKGQDGQKMSKSLGNAVSLEYYLEKFGSDVTRLSLVSYTTLKEDFIFTEERLQFYKNFSERLWQMGRVIEANKNNSRGLFELNDLSREDKYLLSEIDKTALSVSSYLEKYSFAFAQERLVNFLNLLEKFIEIIKMKKNKAVSLSVLRFVFKKYLILLHPFMPFMTEELYANLYSSSSLLAASLWPDKMDYFGN